MRLLICDDSAFSRRSVKQGIPSDLSVTVEEAVNGEEALAKCRAGGIDLMVLDLNMPVLDGFGVLTALQKDSINVPVIVLTANLQSEPAERVKALGARAVMQKPVDAPKLEKLVRFFLDKKAQ